MATLKELREAAILTQQELADKSGVGRVTIALLEKGGYRRRGPYPSTIRKLAKALKVKPQDIDFETMGHKSELKGYR